MSITIDQIMARCRTCGDCIEQITNAKTEHAKRYPMFHHESVQYNLRRTLYLLVRGHLEPSRRLAPDCGNPYCINPDHQLALTEKQKSKRAAKNGAFSRPARNAKIAEAKRKNAVLTLEIAREIRVSEESGPVLAQRYGVNRSLITRIRAAKCWIDYRNPFSGLARV